MPHLFALQGSGNCGKSDTLIRLFYSLQTKYPSANVQPLYKGTKDISVIMSGVNGLVVGIESQGDPIFCACRTKGMTVSWVNALSGPYSIHFVAQPVVATNYGPTNAATALSLIQRAGI
jgi:hypothetical protein